jgi:hypothetical protein
MQRVAQAVFQAVISEFEPHHRCQILMGTWARWSGRNTVNVEIAGSSPVVPASFESVAQMALERRSLKANDVGSTPTRFTSSFAAS